MEFVVELKISEFEDMVILLEVSWGCGEEAGRWQYKTSGTYTKLNFEPSYYHAKFLLILSHIRSVFAVVRSASGANTDSINLEGSFQLSNREVTRSVSKSFKKWWYEQDWVENKK